MAEETDLQAFRKALAEALRIEKKRFKDVTLLAQRIIAARKEKYSYKEECSIYISDPRRIDSNKIVKYSEYEA